MNAIHQNGKATFTAGAAIAKGEFVKFSSGKVVKAAAATDVCIGVALDSAAADGDIIPVQLLSSGDTALVKAGGAVAQGRDPPGAALPDARRQRMRICVPRT